MFGGWAQGKKLRVEGVGWRVGYCAPALVLLLVREAVGDGEE